jgi:hypothetical protein
MKPVLIESPYAGEIEENKRYARSLMRYCLLNGMAPFASHLLYTQPGVLDDRNPEERKLGIEAGLVIGRLMSESIVGIDRGMSTGMKYGIERAEKENRPITQLQLPGWVSAADPEADAKIAYQAYGDNAEWKNFMGNAMPKWEDLPEAIRGHWVAAAKALVR